MKIDARHAGPEEVYCDACEKTFHAWVCYIPHYSAEAVDCLNGAPHSFEPCQGYQVTHNIEKECSMCGERQYGTPGI